MLVCNHSEDMGHPFLHLYSNSSIYILTIMNVSMDPSPLHISIFTFPTFTLRISRDSLIWRKAFQSVTFEQNSYPVNLNLVSRLAGCLHNKRSPAGVTSIRTPFSHQHSSCRLCFICRFTLDFSFKCGWISYARIHSI